MRGKTIKKDLMVKRTVRLKLKKRKMRLILTTITLLAIAILTTAIFYKVYTNYKTGDLSYSTKF